MSDSSRLSVRCPCCDAELRVDPSTGIVLSHREPDREPAGGETFDSLFTSLGEEKGRREGIFEREVASLKDRDRILDAKFEEALRRAEEDDDASPPIRPFDLD